MKKIIGYHVLQCDDVENFVDQYIGNSLWLGVDICTS